MRKLRIGTLMMREIQIHADLLNYKSINKSAFLCSVCVISVLFGIICHIPVVHLIIEQNYIFSRRKAWGEGCF